MRAAMPSYTKEAALIDLVRLYALSELSTKVNVRDVCIMRCVKMKSLT